MRRSSGSSNSSTGPTSSWLIIAVLCRVSLRQELDGRVELITHGVPLVDTKRKVTAFGKRHVLGSPEKNSAMNMAAKLLVVDANDHDALISERHRVLVLALVHAGR